MKQTFEKRKKWLKEIRPILIAVIQTLEDVSTWETGSALKDRDDLEAAVRILTKLLASIETSLAI